MHGNPETDSQQELCITVRFTEKHKGAGIE